MVADRAVTAGVRPWRVRRVPFVVITAGLAALALAMTGCMNLVRPDEPAATVAHDITFAATQVTANGAGLGFVVVGGATSLLYDAATGPVSAPVQLSWGSAASTALPDGRLVVATAPSGTTQTPQIVAVSSSVPSEEVLVGRPEQRPLPLVAGAPVSPDGTLATEAFLGTVLDVEAMPDGSVVWLEQLWIELADQHAFVVRRVAPDGTLETVAGRAGDATAEPSRPVAGSMATETFLDAPDPRLAPLHDGSVVVSTQSWTLRVGTDGVFTEVAPDLPACSTEPSLVEADAEGLLLVRVARAPGSARDVTGWEAAVPSEPATEVVDNARDGATCSVVAVPTASPSRGTVERVPLLDGASAAAFSGEGDLLALFAGPGDLTAVSWITLP